MKNIFSISLICLSLSSTAQSGTADFTDSFVDNSNGWLSADTSENAGLTLIGGNLAMDGATGRHSTSIAKHIDNTRDFEIEISYTIIKRPGKYDNAGRLFWGFSDSLGGSWVDLSLDYFRFTYCRGGDHKNDKHKSFYTHPHLKTDVPIKLTIQKIAGKYYVLVNGEKERTLRFEPLPGEDLAIEVTKNSALQVHGIMVRYLD